jgi:hypothetical protein
MGGDVARQHEAKLVAARARHHQALSRLQVHTALLTHELRAIDAPDAAATAALAAADGVGGAERPHSPGGEAAAEHALAASLSRIEAAFTHRRPPPAQRPAALVARWRRLQLGEPFELAPDEEGGGARGGGGGGEPSGIPRRVWVTLSADVCALEVRPSKGAAPSLRVPLAEVTPLTHSP